jgi:hypothetical protein
MSPEAKPIKVDPIMVVTVQKRAGMALQTLQIRALCYFLGGVPTKPLIHE